MDKYEEMARECLKCNEGQILAHHANIVADAFRWYDSGREKETCEWGEVMDAVPTCINPTGKVVVCRRIVEVKK